MKIKRLADLTALLSLVFISALVFRDGFFNKFLLSSGDCFTTFLPAYLFVGRAIKSLTLPLWTPYLQGGMPFLSYVESDSLYPPVWIFAFLDPIKAYNLFLFLHFMAIGIFFYLFCRSMPLAPLASWVSAITYQYSALVLEHICYGGFPSFAWMPLLLCMINLFRNTTRVRYLILGSLCLSVPVFAGHPQQWFYFLHVAFGYVLFQGFFCVKSEQRYRYWIGLSTMVVAGILIACLQIIPSMSLLMKGTRTHISYEELIYGAIDLKTLLINLVTHPLDAGPALTGPETNAYIGFLPFLMALASLWTVSKKEKWFWSLMVLFGVALTTKEIAPFVYKFLHCLPIYKSLKFPPRQIFLVVFSLSILAGLFVDHLEQNKSSQPVSNIKGFFTWFVAIAAVFLFDNQKMIFAERLSLLQEQWFSTAISSSQSFGYGMLSWTQFQPFLRPLLFMSLVTALIIFCVYTWRKLYWVRFVLIFLILWDLKPLLFNPLAHLATTPDSFIKESYAVLPPTAKIILENEVRSKSPFRIALFSPESIFDLINKSHIQRPWEQFYSQLLGPSISQNFKIPHAGLISSSFNRIKYNSLLEMNFEGRITESIIILGSSRILPLLNIKYVLTHTWALNDRIVRKLFQKYPYRLLYNKEDIYLYERLDVQPRFWFVEKTVVEPDEDTIRLSLKSGHYNDQIVDLNRLAFLANPADFSDDISFKKNSVKIISYDFNKIKLSLKVVGKKCFLVASEVYDPDWKADIDGQPASIHETNYNLRGVIIPQGEHVLTFRYGPRSVILGVLLALSGIFVLTAGGLFVLRSKARD